MILLLRDAIRTAGNPAVIAALILLILAGSLATSGAVAGTSPSGYVPSSGVNVAIAYNYSGGYRFGVLSFNGVGEVAAKMAIQLAFSLTNTSGPPLDTLSGVTDSAGFLGILWDVSPCRCSVGVTASGPLGSVQIGQLALQYPPPVTLTALVGTLSPVTQGPLLGRPALLAAIADFGGTVPSGTTLQYCAPFVAGNPSTCSSHVLGVVTMSLQTFPTVLFGSLSDSEIVNISLIGPGGYVIDSLQEPFIALDPNNPSNYALTATGSGLVAAVQTTSLFVALAGVLIGYVSYARDRLSGTLDPVLALPITRSRLMLSRYASGAIASIIGSALGAVAIDLSLSRVASANLPTPVCLGLFATFAVESVVLVGFAFLGAHLTRSPTVLLVLLILVSALLTLLWLPILTLATHLTRSPVDLSTVSAQSGYSGFSPIQTAMSIVGYVTLRMDGGGPYLLPTITSTPLLAVLLVTWIAVPMAAAWLLIRYRD